MRKILIVFLLLALLTGCTSTGKPTVTAPSNPTQQKEDTVFTDSVYAKAQLLCGTDTLEDAEELAELYGITLVGYKNGLARFHTEEDPRDVIRRGKDNGWPELVLNRVIHLD